MKHEPNATANATAVTVGVLYVACRALVLLVPDLLLAVARTWFHGFDISATSGAGDMSTFIIGLITSVAVGWATGYLFAKSYNYFAKK